MDESVFHMGDATEAQRGYFTAATDGVIVLAPGVNQPDQTVYSIDAPDFAKVLRESGASVGWATEDRDYLDLKSIEIYLGTIVVTLITTVVANVISDAIDRYTVGRAVGRLNIRIVETETSRSFEADGEADKVVNALREWNRDD